MNTEGAKFEVGKFYRFGVGSYSQSKHIPALCVKILKRKIFFKHLAKLQDGRIVKRVDFRWLTTYDNGEQSAHVADVWTTVPRTSAKDVCEKPSKWDECADEET